MLEDFIYKNAQIKIKKINKDPRVSIFQLIEIFIVSISLIIAWFRTVADTKYVKIFMKEDGRKEDEHGGLWIVHYEVWYVRCTLCNVYCASY